jgi:hypothetical protein
MIPREIRTVSHLKYAIRFSSIHIDAAGDGHSYRVLTHLKKFCEERILSLVNLYRLKI